MPKNIDTAAIEALRDTLRRNPGATEAGVRSYLRGEYGDSSALDVALESGEVGKRGNKLYIRATDTTRPDGAIARSFEVAENLTDERPSPERPYAVQVQMRKARERNDWAEYSRLARTNEARKVTP